MGGAASAGTRARLVPWLRGGLGFSGTPGTGGCQKPEPPLPRRTPPRTGTPGVPPPGAPPQPKPAHPPSDAPTRRTRTDHQSPTRFRTTCTAPTHRWWSQPQCWWTSDHRHRRPPPHRAGSTSGHHQIRWRAPVVRIHRSSARERQRCTRHDSADTLQAREALSFCRPQSTPGSGRTAAMKSSEWPADGRDAGRRTRPQGIERSGGTWRATTVYPKPGGGH